MAILHPLARTERSNQLIVAIMAVLCDRVPRRSIDIATAVRETYPDYPTASVQGMVHKLARHGHLKQSSGRMTAPAMYSVTP